jgi:hypothetical protein
MVRIHSYSGGLGLESQNRRSAVIRGLLDFCQSDQENATIRPQINPWSVASTLLSIHVYF